MALQVMLCMKKEYNKPKYKTNYPDLFFINEPRNGFVKQYVEFIPLATNFDEKVGYIVLDLRERDGITKDAFSDLTTSDGSQLELGNFSFAVYENGHIVNSGGKGYNYERKMPLSVLNNPLLFTEGLTNSGYKHLGVTGKNNRKIIVSSEEMTPSGLYSNFSFLFLVLVVTIICVMLLYSVRYGFNPHECKFGN